MRTKATDVIVTRESSQRLNRAMIEDVASGGEGFDGTVVRASKGNAGTLGFDSSEFE